MEADYIKQERFLYSANLVETYDSCTEDTLVCRLQLIQYTSVTAAY